MPFFEPSEGKLVSEDQSFCTIAVVDCYYSLIIIFALMLLTETSGDSDTGASIVGIIASLEVEDYTEDEVRRAISLLINLGEVYSTIDENHYAIPGEERTVPRLPAAATAVATVAHAYGSVVNDAVIRLLRDAQSGEEGLSLADIVQGLTHSEVEVRVALDHLLYEGHIYTTIDDNHFQWSEYPSH